MSRKAEGTLLYLAHPLIVSASEEIGKHSNGRHLPPFPGVDLAWKGFSIPHLRWIGVSVLTREDWEIELALLHELCHTFIASSSFLILKKNEIMRFYELMVDIFFDEQEKIDVPVTADLSGNMLQKQWSVIQYCSRVTMLVEEIYAVHTSLSQALELGIIDGSILRVIRRKSKRAYGKYIDDYSDAYDTYDSIVREIGVHAAGAMVKSALETGNPTLAFFDLLSQIKSILQGDSDYLKRYKRYITEPKPYEEMFWFFSEILNTIDKDGSRYRRSDVEQDAMQIRQQWNVAIENDEDDFTEFLFGTPTTLLFTRYADFIHSYSDEGHCPVVEIGNMAIFLEAIMQQLITGLGLICPFWMYSPNRCCSRENRALLEQVWKCTSATPSCKTWKRVGCLNRKDWARFKRRKAKKGRD